MHGHELIEGNFRLGKRNKGCLKCHLLCEERRRREEGVKPFRPSSYTTKEQKQSQNRKWENKRRALKKQAFIEDVDPLVIYTRDKGLCQICLKPINDLYEIDHIIPLARGGKHSYENTQLAHPSCNRHKWAKI
jgi:5-methylcytosine-specific restriction endonuclease McrA